jgi:hypothetical protein
MVTKAMAGKMQNGDQQNQGDAKDPKHLYPAGRAWGRSGASHYPGFVASRIGVGGQLSHVSIL